MSGVSLSRMESSLRTEFLGFLMKNFFSEAKNEGDFGGKGRSGAECAVDRRGGGFLG